jgi:hypothetical protein
MGVGPGLDDGEHLWGEVDAKDGPGGADRVAQGGEGPAGAAADVGAGGAGG